MTDDDIQLIHSPLTQTYSADGHTLQIEIYRGAGSLWILEIVDELGTSSIWEAQFETDTAALAAAFLAIEKEGIHQFVITAQREAEETERGLAQAARPRVPGATPDFMAPLSDEELDELDGLLLDQDTEEGMTLDMLDGFLHALALGPETVLPSRWLPKVLGQGDGDMLPPVADLDDVKRLVELVMRRFNSIVLSLEQVPPAVYPLWPITSFDADEFEDAQIWAYGFTEAVKLSPAAWQPLFDHPEGRQWYRPIYLLGADEVSPEEDELTRSPAQRAALTAQIEGSLLRMHAFWLPLRQAVAEREQVRRRSPKVGRNEPCPCGSGKKFKKCCGASSEWH